jgi:hypothetical protein
MASDPRRSHIRRVTKSSSRRREGHVAVAYAGLFSNLGVPSRRFLRPAPRNEENPREESQASGEEAGG